MSRFALVLCLTSVAAVQILHAQRPADLVNRRFIAEVAHVADGDTVQILVHPARMVTLRLHGVDTPESDEAFSVKVRARSRE